ncbi:MAG: hypothetical protein ACLTUZ_03585 [Sellimonas intestinalis]|uniref:hypothetical protein n=1 Tax=Sellimonas intestinalis TaxID=1653434 RepID=UPI003991D037
MQTANWSEFYQRGVCSLKKCAGENNIPLYTDISQLNSKDVDIVCVAVKSSITGGDGAEIALECLKKRNKCNSRATGSL